MDQDALLGAIGKHIDALQAIFSWGAALAATLYWVALKGDDPLEFVKLKFERREAFQVAAVVYLCAVVALLLLLFRLQSLIEMLNDAHFLKGYTALAAHQWLLNPFAYLGESTRARLSTQWSIGVLIGTWWLGATSVALLLDGKPRIRLILIPALFFGTGILVLMSVSQIYSLNLSRLLTNAPAVHAGVKATAGGRWAAIWIGLVVGVLIFVITLWWQHQHPRPPKKP